MRNGRTSPGKKKLSKKNRKSEKISLRNLGLHALESAWYSYSWGGRPSCFHQKRRKVGREQHEREAKWFLKKSSDSTPWIPNTIATRAAFSFPPAKK
jgi:hypothetical protein